MVGRTIAFRGLSCLAKARQLDRVEKPPRSSGNPGKSPAARPPALPELFMEFRGPAADPNRPQKPIACPTSDLTGMWRRRVSARLPTRHARVRAPRLPNRARPQSRPGGRLRTRRSEEHTSELQALRRPECP